MLSSTSEPYLIFLDDYTPKIWPRLMECFPETGTGSRVVISTAEPIAIDEFMQEQETGEADEWKSFVSVIKIIGNDIKEKHLQGLPRSYHELLPLLKVCFLYLSIFPKGNEVPLRRVWNLWLSEGFLDQNRTNEGLTSVPPLPPPASLPRDVFWICFGILVDRKLVEVTKWKLDGSPKSCRITIFLHDPAATILKSTGLFNVYNGPVDGAQVQGETPIKVSRVQRLASHAEGEIPSGCVNRHLRAYVSFQKKTGGKLNEEISVHLKTLTRKPSYVLLKLLDLEAVYKPKLPDSIGILQYLRFLGLRSTLLDSLPTSVAKLQRLETLDLKHTHVVNLPTSLLRSANLLHLHAKEVHLDDFINTGPWQCHCVLSCTRPKWLPSFSNLETLTGLYLGGAVSMETGSHLFGKLRELEVTCGASLTGIQQFIDGMTHLQALKLRSNNTAHAFSLTFSSQQHLEKIYLCGNMNQRDAIFQLRQLPAGLKKLTLSKSGLEDDPMPVLGKLKSLEVLRLLGDSYHGAKMNCTGFPKLRVLKLWNLANLIRLSVKEDSMPELEDMEIRNCSKMETFKGSEFLPDSFNMLVLHEMSEVFLKYIGEQKISQKTSGLPNENQL